MEESLAALVLAASLVSGPATVTTRADVAPAPRSGGIATDIVNAGHTCRGGVMIEAMTGPEAQVLEARGLRPMIARCDSGEQYRIVYRRRPAHGGAPMVQSVTPVR